MAEPQRRPLLSDLLAELRSRGVSIGIREHYEVAWLLERWPDLSTLRDALGSILGTDREEARIVRETFDELYPGGWQDLDEVERVLVPVLALGVEDETRVSAELKEVFGEDEDGGRGEKEEPTDGPEPSWRGFLRAYWPGLLAAVALSAVILFLAWPVKTEPHAEEIVELEATSEEGVRPPKPDPAQLLGDLPDPPPLPNWSRGAVAGGALGLAVFLWLYWVRTGRQARQAGYQLLAERVNLLADPQSYALDLNALDPPFDGGLLDDVAMLLSRQVTVAEARREIDVDESVERTLESGLAPHLVFAKRTSAEPVLVLEDVAAEMRPYRLRTAAFLAAMRERGVYFEHWRFDGDADRLFQDSGLAIGLERLVRERSASPLLILSTGRGILCGDDFERAAWVGRLHYWLSRAWLHPSPDPTTWRRVVQELPMPVWPLNAKGLRAAARHLAAGETDATTSELRLMERPQPATPLQVNRLRRLLDLSPQRTAGVGELLRQQFCPRVPPTAVVEALAAPPLEHPPAIGPSENEVRAFLIELLDKSRPREAGSAAELRWRLDRALQSVHLEGERERGLETLGELGDGPLAAEVAVAVEPLAEAERDEALSEEVRGALTRRVLVPIGHQARQWGKEQEGREGGRRWSRPTFSEILVPLFLIGMAWLGTPYLGPTFSDQLQDVQEAFELTVSYPSGESQSGPFEVEAIQTVAGTRPLVPLAFVTERLPTNPLMWVLLLEFWGIGAWLFAYFLYAVIRGQRQRAHLPLLQRHRSQVRSSRGMIVALAFVLIAGWIEAQGSVPGGGSSIALYQDDVRLGALGSVGQLPEDARGHWYWVGAQLENGVFGVSRPVWVRSPPVGKP